LFHITVAIARFFEFLLLDIAKSIAGVVVVVVLGLVGCVAGVLGLLKLGRRIAKGPR